jgi:hypothetical protein
MSYDLHEHGIATIDPEMRTGCGKRDHRVGPRLKGREQGSLIAHGLAAT